MSPSLLTGCLSAALLGVLACQPAAAIEAVAGTQLVMHVGPGAHYPSVGDVPAETRVTVHGCSEAEGWCLVRFGRRHGWIEGESLNVVGFSRPPQAVTAVLAPAAQEPLPVPVAPDALLPFISADDVVIGMDEQFGLAAFVPGRVGKHFRFALRHHGRFAFKHGGFRHELLVRHGHFKHRHFGKRGHFAKHGHFALDGNHTDARLHFDGFGGLRIKGGWRP